MMATIYKTSQRESIFIVLALGALLYLYHRDIQPMSFHLRRAVTDRLAFKDSECRGMRVIRTCAREELVKVLFVVDTILGSRSNRRFARNAYAKRTFAKPIQWLTVFRMLGNVTDNNGKLASKAHSECRAFGDIVIHRNHSSDEIFELQNDASTSSYLQFLPWILENCPRVDLVVFMQDNVIPNPFYLPTYRAMHMDHRPEVIHCHSSSGLPTSVCYATSVVMAKQPGLGPFASKVRVIEGEFFLGGLEATDMGSYLAVNETMTTLYTSGAVVFYTFPQGLNMPMTSLWNEVMRAPENSPDVLRI